MKAEAVATLEAVLEKVRALGDEMVRIDDHIAAVEAALLEAGCRVSAWTLLKMSRSRPPGATIDIASAVLRSVGMS